MIPALALLALFAQNPAQVLTVTGETPAWRPSLGYWTVSQPPLAIACYRNGARQITGADFTIAGTIIKSATWAPASDKLVCDYSYAGPPDPTVSDLQAQINVLSAQAIALQARLTTSSDAKVAFFDALSSQCVTCVDEINTALANAAKAPSLYGVIICCGPTTVPPTPPGSQLIWLMPADPTNPFQPAPAHW